MKYLFDSKGNHVANLINEHLYSIKGVNIGHYITNPEIFVDMNGMYLGEIYFDDRLVKHESSPYIFTNHGIIGEFGYGGIHGSPEKRTSINLPFGYKDVDIEELLILKDI